jgi:hypothetical protein
VQRFDSPDLATGGISRGVLLSRATPMPRPTIRAHHMSMWACNRVNLGDAPCAITVYKT